MPGDFRRAGALVAYYSFDNTSGTAGGSTVYDGVSGGTLNGLMGTGSDAPTIQFDATRNSNVINFATSLAQSGSSYMEIDNLNSVMPALNFNSGATAWAFSMWVETTTQGGTFLSKGGTAASGDYNVATGSNGTDFYSHGSAANAGPDAGGVRKDVTNGGNFYASSGPSMTDGNWDLITFQNSGSGLNIYTNGKLSTNIAASNYNASIGDTSTIFRLGWSPSAANGNKNYVGSIDDLAFWNNSLSDGEAKGSYSMGIGTLSTGGSSPVIQSYGADRPANHLRLSEGSLSSATISSGGQTIVWTPTNSLPSGGTLGQVWSSGGNYYVMLQSSSAGGLSLGVVGAPAPVVWSGTSSAAWEDAANWSFAGGTVAVAPDGAGRAFPSAARWAVPRARPCRRPHGRLFNVPRERVHDDRRPGHLDPEHQRRFSGQRHSGGHEFRRRTVVA